MNMAESHRGIKIIGVILIIYAALVATHEGEFWPFSIYPMFSQAGNPWTRAMVLDVTDLPDHIIWQEHQLDQKIAPPIPLRSIGVDQIDYSNFISKTEEWTPTRLDALRQMLGPNNIQDRRWMAAKVRGTLVGDDSVSVTIQPFLLVTADSVYINPNLPPGYYQKGEQ